MKGILLIVVFGLFVGCISEPIIDEWVDCPDGSSARTLEECPAPTPAPKGFYEDENLRIQFPAFTGEPSTSMNDFFIMNQEEKRSYALNYYLYNVTEEAAESGINHILVSCFQESDAGGICYPIEDPFEYGPFWVFCFIETLEGTDVLADKCMAMTVCDNDLVTISVAQETEVMVLPFEEFIGVLDSLDCVDTRI